MKSNLISKFAKSLQHNKFLTKIYISDTIIHNIDIINIAEMLKTNKTLKIIDFSQITIETEGAKAIAKSLEINKTLLKVNLNVCFSDIDGIDCFCEMLKLNKTLTHLDLSGNRGIVEANMKLFFEILSNENNSLQSLNLSRFSQTNVSNEYWNLFFKMFEKNKTLNYLNILPVSSNIEITNKIIELVHKSNFLQ